MEARFRSALSAALQAEAATSEVTLSRHVGAFVWSGQQLSEITLSPQEGATVQLSASFCRPGVFNLATLTLRVTLHDESDSSSDVTSQQARTPAFVVISSV